MDNHPKTDVVNRYGSVFDSRMSPKNSKNIENVMSVVCQCVRMNNCVEVDRSQTNDDESKCSGKSWRSGRLPLTENIIEESPRACR